jgi:hypothetical protein
VNIFLLFVIVMFVCLASFIQRNLVYYGIFIWI